MRLRLDYRYKAPEPIRENKRLGDIILTANDGWVTADPDSVFLGGGHASDAYPSADATSYTITGLAAGDYHVKVRARYDDNGSGPFKGSAVVQVEGAAEREAEDPDRSIQAIGVSSPAAGTIQVIWGAPGDTDTLNSYRVMWAPEGQSHP